MAIGESTVSCLLRGAELNECSGSVEAVEAVEPTPAAPVEETAPAPAMEEDDDVSNNSGWRERRSADLGQGWICGCSRLPWYSPHQAVLNLITSQARDHTSLLVNLPLSYQLQD